MTQRNNLRIHVFLGITLLVAGAILYRLFTLSVVNHSSYLLTSRIQSESINNIIERGNIYLSGGNGEALLVATNKKFPLAYIVPADVESNNRSYVARELAHLLGLDEEKLISDLESDSKSLRVVARKLSDNQIEEVSKIDSDGVGISHEVDRFYPGDFLASNVIGFLGYNSEGKRAGQYGIEGYYDGDLVGKRIGFSAKDAPSKIFNFAKGLISDEGIESENEISQESADIILTIDKNVQAFIEDKLEDLMGQWEAESGSVIVQEPKTGAIIAMADWPSFNPNNYFDFETRTFLNSNIQDTYEPGSSFKPMTMAVGLDLAEVTPQTTYEDLGFINVSGYTIKNFSDRIFGISTMTEVLEKSINTGTMFVENKVGDDNFLNYVVNMGFGQKTGIELPGEVGGNIENLYTGRKINYLTASFGQGITVTPLQLINAYSAIANGGKLMRPYIVKKIIKDRGEEYVTEPEIVTIPISDKTAVKLQTMLTSVVDHGFDRATIRGYDVAGKTGTAQMVDKEGGYSEDDFIHNFVGFAPSYNAKFVILIKMNKPQGIQFAADSLSPTFREMTAYLLNYYKIPPTRK